MAGRDRSLIWILLCFVLSGFVALLYQTAWTREFAFVFGTSELAVATVLAAYMAGLSAGAALGGRWAPRIRRPVWTYAVLELGIGASALAVPAAIALCTHLAVALFGGVPEPPDASGWGLPLFFLSASFLILLVPTALMGATLPLLARHAVRTERELGPRIAWLYGLNTAGAVLGTVCAAFLLLPALGLRTTVAVGAGLNVVVFLLAARVGRSARPMEVSSATTPALGGSWRIWSHPQRVLPLMLLSGAVSFAYEILWTRLLGHVLGGSVHAFATMLASFLAGIALGSAAASRWTRSREAAARSFAGVQIGIALTSAAAYASLDRLPWAAQALGAHAGGSLSGSAALAAAVLLPSTLFIGATFPLAVRILARNERDAGPASARVLAWNTIGSILGAIAGGFVLLPRLGYDGTLTLCLMTGLGIAVVAAWGLQPRSRRSAAVAVALLASLLVVQPAPPWNLLRSSSLSLEPLPGEMTYFGVGRSATVSLVDLGFAWRLRSNGLPEANILPPLRDRLENAAHGWLGVLPVLYRPESRSLLVVGLGGGALLEWVPQGIERIDVVELEPEIVEANRAVADLRARDPLRDPRLRIHLNDARGALMLSDRRWDVIVSQPSHPWTAGASHLYTREFFALAREHLTPGGVLVQWIGLAYVDTPLLRSLVATLRDVFPQVNVYRVGAELLFVASEGPLDPLGGVEVARQRDSAPLDALGLWSPEAVAAPLLLNTAGTRQLASGAPVSTDDRNLLQMRARSALRDPLSPSDVEALLAPFDPLSTPDFVRSLDPVHLVQSLLETGQPERASRVARSLREPRARRLALALVALQGSPAEGRRLLEGLIAEDGPRAGAVRKLLLEALLLAGRSDGRVETLAEALGEVGVAFADAWRFEQAGRWPEVRAREALLARIGPRDPWFPASIRMRVRWRIELGRRERAAEAVELTDRGLARSRSPRMRLLRAWALARAGAANAALGDLEVLTRLFQGQGRVALARNILTVLADLPREPDLARRRFQLERQARWVVQRAGRPAATATYGGASGERR